MTEQPEPIVGTAEWFAKYHGGVDPSAPPPADVPPAIREQIEREIPAPQVPAT